MIGIKRITTADTQYYNYIEQLLIASFPVEEYRDLNILKEYTDTRTNFYCNIILDDQVPVGLLTYWDLGNFYYIEHFAIDPDQRNSGYGRKLLNLLTGILKRPIVLEVEHPTEEMAQRRINFYQRQGYILWEKEYFQPPYRVGYDNLPMYLMVNGNLNAEKDFETVKSKIHHEVYNVNVADRT